MNYLSTQNIDYLIIEVPSSHGMIFKLSKFFLNLNIFSFGIDCGKSSILPFTLFF